MWKNCYWYKEQKRIYTPHKLTTGIEVSEIDILPDTCQRFIQNYLDATCEILSSNSNNRVILNLVTHSCMALKDVPKEIQKENRYVTLVLCALVRWIWGALSFM